MAGDDVRVLVVDDLVDAANTLAWALQASGYQVQTAHDGRQALQSIQACAPHCVILDIDMPDIDGCELSRELRRMYGDDLVLIAMTGREENDLRVAETFVRVDHYLKKPFAMDELHKILPQRVS